MAQHVSIDTAQNVKLNYDLAGVGPRIVAYLLDGLIKAAYIVIMAVIFFAVLDISNTLSDSEPVIILGIICFLPVMLYSFLFEAFYNGQTPGKIALKIKVIRLDGAAPTIGNYFLRWLLRIIDMQLFYGLPAIISIAASTNAQRLGDMAAGTTVISLSVKVRLKDIAATLPKEPLEYIPTYPEVNKLSDKDIEIIKLILKNTGRNKNTDALYQTALKVKSLMEIEYVKQTDRDFLQTIINDFNYYSGDNE